MSSKLTIGPILFHWSEEKKLDFYAQIADEAPVDTVYLGEVICSKRTPFFEKHYFDVAERLKRAGKKVVFSTLSEVVIKRDRMIIKDFCDLSDTEEVEVNDASALPSISGHAHRLGPFLNVYNEETLRFLASKGATHVCLPIELPKESIQVMRKEAEKLNMTVEIQVFGRMSLALSSRCYHARAHGRVKDNCLFVCEKDVDGMTLNTLSKKPFLAINGIQTMSYKYMNLINEVKDIGIDYLRLSPHTNNMVATAEIFDHVINDKMAPDEAHNKLLETGVSAPFANGFYHHEAGYKWV